jgi:hypothetical protein
MRGHVRSLVHRGEAGREDSLVPRAFVDGTPRDGDELPAASVPAAHAEIGAAAPG